MRWATGGLLGSVAGLVPELLLSAGGFMMIGLGLGLDWKFDKPR